MGRVHVCMDMIQQLHTLVCPASLSIFVGWQVLSLATCEVGVQCSGFLPFPIHQGHARDPWYVPQKKNMVCSPVNAGMGLCTDRDGTDS